MTIGPQYPSLVGGPGMVLTAGSSGNTWMALDLPSDTDFKKLKERVDAIEKRLAILQPNQTLQDKYPALQEAYDHYKTIEKLVDDKGGK